MLERLSTHANETLLRASTRRHPRGGPSLMDEAKPRTCFRLP